MNARFVGTTADQVLNEFGAIPLGIGMNRADARKGSGGAHTHKPGQEGGTATGETFAASGLKKLGWPGMKLSRPTWSRN